MALTRVYFAVEYLKVKWMPSFFHHSTSRSKKGIPVQVAPSKSRLVEAAESYLASRQFNQHAQKNFSTLFHSYHSAASLDDRIAAAYVLADARGVPLDVLMLLCCDEDVVATPILMHSPVLISSELTTHILQGTLAERKAIARRTDLNSVLVSHLLSFGEKQVAQTLIGNQENLPSISENLLGRMTRLSEADQERTGQRTMTQDKGKLDALVSSMEQGWSEHYQPETLLDAKTELEEAMPANQSTETPSTDAPLADDSAQDFLGPEELALLEKLGGTDWAELDDDAIEALAGSLARENAQQLEDAQNDERRISFTIGADDSNNARIPPLEVHDDNMRTATISFAGQTDDFSNEQAEQAEDIATPNVAADVEPVADTSLQAALNRPLDQEEEAVLSDKLEAQPKADAAIKSSPTTDISNTEERKPQIKLTIRKRVDAPIEETNVPVTEPASSVQLCSATEDDWHKALDRLNRDFDPQSAVRATTGFIDATQVTPQAASEATPSQNTTSAPAIVTSGLDHTVSLSQPITEALPPATAAEQTPEEHLEETRPSAPMGFMPDTVAFDDLDLVEAVPDMPSATELLLTQQKNSAPYVEMIEPVDLAYIENGKMVSVDEVQSAPMQVVVEQLAAERDAKRDTLNTSEFDTNAITDDMTDLPSLSAHRVVDVEEFSDLKARSEEVQNTLAPEIGATAVEPSIAKTETGLDDLHDTVAQLQDEMPSRPTTGVADDFYQYDETTRLSLLQSIMADTLATVSHQEEDAKTRTLLDEHLAQELVMARFGNDRIRVADLMHDISGHRRLDMTRLLQDSGGEALIVYLYSIGLDESNTLSFLLHGPDAVSHNYSRVEQLMTLYTQLYPSAAGKIVEQLFGAGKSTKAKYLPVHDDGAGQSSPRLRSVSRSEQTQKSDNATPAFGRRLSYPD